jgi:hypothetical protein
MQGRQQRKLMNKTFVRLLSPYSVSSYTNYTNISRYLNFIWYRYKMEPAGDKCCVAVVKSCPVLHFSVVTFFWSLCIVDSNTFKCWKLSTVQNGAKGWEGCWIFHYLSCTDLIIPSLQFLYTFAVVNASEGSLFPDIHYRSTNNFILFVVLSP